MRRAHEPSPALCRVEQKTGILNNRQIALKAADLGNEAAPVHQRRKGRPKLGGTSHFRVTGAFEMPEAAPFPRSDPSSTNSCQSQMITSAPVACRGEAPWQRLR